MKIYEHVCDFILCTVYSLDVNIQSDVQLKF